jgi:tubulin---tyrosine ligase
MDKIGEGNEPPSDEIANYYGDINFLWTQWRRAKFISQLQPNEVFQKKLKQEETNPTNNTILFQSLYNRIDMNFHLSNKKALFINMKRYYECIGEDPFDTLPLTFHCEKGMEDP